MLSVRKILSVRLLLAGACMSGASGHVGAQIVPITGLSSVRTDVAALNDSNVVVGHYFTDFDGPFGYSYTPGGGMSALPKPSGTTKSEPYAISNTGIIAGQAYTGPSGKIMKIVGGTATGISPPTGFSGGAAYGVNDSGTMVGYFFGSGAGGRVFSHTDAGGFERFSTEYSDAFGINNVGQVTGSFFFPGGFPTGYRRDPDGTRTPIGSLLGGGDSSGRAINNLGTVFGHASDGHGVVPVRYTSSSGLVQLQSFAGQNIIRGANDFNYAVGFQYDASFFEPTLWRPDGTLLNLDDWLDATHPALGALWDLEEAADVNNLGFIVGEGYYQDPVAGNSYRAFLLDARSIVVPEPAIAAVVIAGLPVAFLPRRRRARAAPMTCADRPATGIPAAVSAAVSR